MIIIFLRNLSLVGRLPVLLLKLFSVIRPVVLVFRLMLLPLLRIIRVLILVLLILLKH